jgi:hypothetical protein
MYRVRNISSSSVSPATTIVHTNRPTHLADLHRNAIGLVFLRTGQQNRANDRSSAECNRGKLLFVSAQFLKHRHEEIRTQTYFKLSLNAHCVPLVAPAMTAGVMPGILVVANALGFVRKIVTNCLADESGKPALIAYSAT